MFSGVYEAFGHPIQNQIDKHIGKSIDYNDKYSAFDVYNNNNNNPYFTVQGDMESRENIKGTKISDLQVDESEIDSSDSLFDELSTNSTTPSLSSLPSVSSTSTLSVDHSSIIDRGHEFYIRAFIKDYKDMESFRLSRKEYKDIYEHVKTCQYCKDEIKLRLNGKDVTVNKSQDHIINNKPKHNMIDNNITDNNLKELAVVILIGIVIILLLDFFTKIKSQLL